MYSDMSMRTIALSSSNRNSASAFVSSVLPTPVGPRNRNEPIGRFGSCSPARARRTAFATALMASSWPTTRSRSFSSMCRSFSRSPSSILSTGMPVHRETTASMRHFQLAAGLIELLLEALHRAELLLLGAPASGKLRRTAFKICDFFFDLLVTLLGGWVALLLERLPFDL